MDSVLDWVDAKPDLFPAKTKDLPDINFFYRYDMRNWDGVSGCFCYLSLFSFRSTQPTASCDHGRSSVITVRCNPEKSDRGELSVPR